MKIKIRYILILLVDLILSSVIIDRVMFGYPGPSSGFRTLPDHACSGLVIDMPAITEDFSSVTVPQAETECSPSASLTFRYVMPVRTINGRSPPLQPRLQQIPQTEFC